MISGQKAAHLALKSLGLPNALDESFVGKIHPELMLAAADSAEIAEAQNLIAIDVKKKKGLAANKSWKELGVSHGVGVWLT